ncbi:hypothetical protein CTI12_AA589470 [Artemisia annua]|uniref:Serine aminopeptidase S33 domain-containing protein n=1 Tax=Artemisia annua TaxID=35608 RepID=A0A2U1KLF3_ARTAN|nr:hypothetical protein CTI12_AA589470 [Artemisia annua]
MYGLLFGLADKWAVMPDPRVGARAIRDVEKQKILEMNPKLYLGKPRVGTMREVVRVTNYLQQNFEKVRVPFFTAHGTADGLASHSGSEMLYEKAATAKEDKELKLYEGMYHSLINGEPDEDANRVLGDMRAWIDDKAKKFGPKVLDNHSLVSFASRHPLLLLLPPEDLASLPTYPRVQRVARTLSNVASFKKQQKNM